QRTTIVWVEALDGGDLKNQVPFRDTVRSLAATFTAQPTEIAKTEWRYGGIAYTDRGGARRGGGSAPIIQNGDYIYLTGQGASPEGDRPFLDRLNLKTLQTERIFRSSAASFASFVAPLNDEMTRVVTRYETQKDAPNLYARDAGSTAKQAVTQFKDPQPGIRGILR